MTAATSSSSSLSLTLTPPNLPLDLVSDILCRLSVKHLLQLCCVCKSWNSLISLDSNFARKQLSLSTSNKDRHQLIQCSTKSYREFLLSHSPISSFFTTAPNFPVKQPRHTLTVHLNTERSRTSISTCDGILCFGIDESLAVLYNPSTGKSKILPPLKTCFQNLYTLAYDRMASNYKVIAIGYFNSIVGVNIHTLGTDYWTSIQDFPCSNHISKPGIFVNDTIYWIAYDTNLPRDDVIISLDLGKESYQKLSPPLYNDDYTGYELSVALGTLRGCLSILSNGDKFSNVWIMKEYGNENSWTKLFSVPHPDQDKGRFCCYVKVLYVSEDDQLLMEFYNKGGYGLVVYDSINNTFSIPKMQNNIYDHKVAPLLYVARLAPLLYVASLISPF